MKLSKYLQKIPLNRLIFIEVILGLLASILSFILFASLTEDILEKETVYYDEFISNFIYSVRTPFLTKVMNIITTIGSLPVFLGLTAIVFFFLIYKKHKFEALIFIVVIAVGEVLNFLFKILFQRPRPQLSPLLVQKDFSYPSGHAMNSLIIYGFIIFLFFRFTRQKNSVLF